MPPWSGLWPPPSWAQSGPYAGGCLEADARIRTADPFITREGRVRVRRPLADMRGYIPAGNLPVHSSRSGRACRDVPALTYPFCTRQQVTYGPCCGRTIEGLGRNQERAHEAQVVRRALPTLLTQVESPFLPNRDRQQPSGAQPESYGYVQGGSPRCYWRVYHAGLRRRGDTNRRAA